MANLSVFSFERKAEKNDKRRKLLQQKKERAREDALFYQRLACHLSSAQYGADSKWDCTFGMFPVYVDIPGFGLCVTTRGRWKDYQGRDVVHWGLYKINPFVEDDSEIRSEHFEVPTDGSVGNIQRKWVIPIPFTLLQFRLNDKNRANSELVFCRAKDYDSDVAECKVMLLSDFLLQVKNDTDRTKGYRVLVDALRMQFPSEVDKYMSLEQRIHGNTTGPAHTQHKKPRTKHKHRQPSPYSIIMAPPPPQNEEDEEEEEEEEDPKNLVTDLEAIDKRIGLGFGVDTMISIEESAAAGSEFNGAGDDFIRRYRMAKFIDENSTACKIRGIMQCDCHLPSVPHALMARMTALSMEQSRTAKLIAEGGDPTTGNTWHFSLFDI